jgi:hypothetical protein
MKCFCSKIREWVRAIAMNPLRECEDNDRLSIGISAEGAAILLCGSLTSESEPICTRNNPCAGKNATLPYKGEKQSSSDLQASALLEGTTFIIAGPSDSPD